MNSKSKDNVSCIILCGGRGSRMGDTTKQIPKPLVSVSGKPILQHILLKLDRVGFDKIVLLTGYKSDKIQEYVDGKQLETSSTELTLLDTGDGTPMLTRIAASKHLLNDYVVVCYGDTFIDLQIERLIDQHVAEERLITIVTGKIKNPFGILQLDEETKKVSSFVEKPVYDYYIGCFVFHKSLLNHATDELLEMADGRGLVTLFHEMIGQNKMFFHRFDGMQVTFNTELERADAEKTLNNYYTISNE